MEVKKFLGLRNTVSAERLKPGELTVAENVDIDDSGKLLTRLGAVLKQAGNFHSLWADEDMALVMGGASGNLLYRVNADYTLTQLATFRAGFPVDMVRQQALVLMSNGVDTLRLSQGQPKLWGTPSPASQPAAAQGAGNLPAGDYLYAVTYRRADGFESGTGPSGLVTLTTTGGIQLTGIPSSTDPDVADIMVYVGSAGGRELFLAAVIPVGTASYAYTGDGTDLGVRLETQFCTAAPAGTIVDIYNGCAYSVQGDTAYYSDPYQFERFRPRTQFMQMPGAITMWAAVNDGIYVSTSEATYFLSGGHPTDMRSKKVFDYGAIPGTAVKSYAGIMEALEDDAKGEPGDMAVVWTTPFGICFGMDGGRVINMTDREYSFPPGARGRGIVKMSRGFTQYKVVLEGPGTASNAYT